MEQGYVPVDVEFPDIKDISFFDEKGKKTLEKSNAKVEIATYWSRQRKLIALLMLIPSVVLLLIFLNESHILEVVWGGTVGAVLKFFGWA